MIADDRPRIFSPTRAGRPLAALAQRDRAVRKEPLARSKGRGEAKSLSQRCGAHVPGLKSRGDKGPCRKTARRQLICVMARQGPCVAMTCDTASISLRLSCARWPASAFDLRLLTDSAIESPRGRYTPESVLQLERGLANNRVSAPQFVH